ncbi:MAG: terminase TerL endonuclease subunit, partial [Hyphomicrobiaceae bacterium]
PTPVASARALSPKPTTPGCWFDAAAADEAVWFFPWYCRFTQGSTKTTGPDGIRKIASFAGRAFELAPWQAWIIRQLFGWKRADGTRLYRRCIVWVPRGNGKTNWAAGIAHLALLRLGVTGAEVYSIASNKDQASIVFNDAMGMLAYSPDLARVYETRKASLYCPETDSVFRPLSGKPSGKHGLKCHTLIGDEIHEWKNGDLYDFVRQSQVKWADPLQFLISTAGEDQNGFGYEVWDECEMIANGALDDPETLVVMFGAKEGDDLADPRVQAAANPNFGISIQPDDLAAAVKNALALPRKLPKLKRYNFNLWASDFATWLPADMWAACTSKPGDKNAWKTYANDLRGRPCTGAFDGASTRDTNARILLFPPAGPDPKWRVLPRFWWPRDSAASQKSGAKIPVESWEADGAITLTPGNVADHDIITASIIEDHAKFNITAFGIDPFNVHQMTQDLMAANVPVVIVPQNMKNLSPAAKAIERLVMGVDLDHGGHPVLKWQAACAAVKEDDQENIMPAKRRSSGKIDGIASLVTACAVGNVEAEAKPYYADSPLVFL